MKSPTVWLTIVVVGLIACDEPEAKPDGADSGFADMSTEDTSSASDSGGDGICPVTDFVSCGGDLVGTWSFRGLCPDDPAAAAALCEHPYDDRPECMGEGNEALCASEQTGTLTFGADGSIVVDTQSTLVATYHFTDACVTAIQRDPNPATGCMTLGTARLSCSYDAGACRCWSDPIVTEDLNTGVYTVEGDEVVLGEDPPAKYCIDGDRLTMDYYLFHPISWRYWVLDRE